jgi:SOS response regulatory protein OraA/RecX
MLFIITVSTFVCITLGVVGLYWALFRPASAATERLKQMQDGTTVATTAPVTLTEERPQVAELAERIATPLSRLVPPSAIEARKIQRQLMQAGFRSENAVVIYRALQLI